MVQNHIDDKLGFYTCDCVDENDQCLIDGQCVVELNCPDMNGKELAASGECCDPNENSEGYEMCCDGGWYEKTGEKTCCAHYGKVDGELCPDTLSPTMAPTGDCCDPYDKPEDHELCCCDGNWHKKNRG